MAWFCLLDLANRREPGVNWAGRAGWQRREPQMQGTRRGSRENGCGKTEAFADFLMNIVVRNICNAQKAVFDNTIIFLCNIMTPVC